MVSLHTLRIISGVNPNKKYLCPIKLILMNIHRPRTALLLFVILFPLSSLPAQSTFQRILSSTDTVFGSGEIIQLDNGHLLLNGVISPNLSNFNGILVELSPEGNTISAQKLLRTGNAPSSYISDMTATSNGGYALVVNDFSTSVNKRIIQFNADGTVQWVRHLNDNTTATLGGIKAGAAGALFVTMDGFDQDPSTTLFKLSSNGTLIWSQTYQKVIFNTAGIYESSDGYLHIAARSTATGTPDGAFLRCDANGIIQQFKIYLPSAPGSGVTQYQYCLRLSSDSLALVGVENDRNLLIAKVGYTGEPGTTMRYTAPTEMTPTAAYVASNGHIFVCTQGGSTQRNGCLAQISPEQLQLVAARYYGASGSEVVSISDLYPRDAGAGLALCGGYAALNALGKKVWVAQTTEEGDIIGRCCPRKLSFTATRLTQGVLNTTVPTSAAPTLSDDIAVLEDYTITNQPFCDTPEEIAISDTLFCPGQCVGVSMQQPMAGAAYKWYFPNALTDSTTAVTPGQICYNHAGTFLIQLNSGGCLLDTTFVRVDHIPDRFPNAFTPNNDDANDIFRPLIECPIDEYYLRIYNRWGALIFESVDLATGWDGTVNGEPAPIDTYIYQVEFYSLRDGVRTLVHNEQKEVTLLR